MHHRLCVSWRSCVYVYNVYERGNAVYAFTIIRRATCSSWRPLFIMEITVPIGCSNTIYQRMRITSLMYHLKLMLVCMYVRTYVWRASARCSRTAKQDALALHCCDLKWKEFNVVIKTVWQMKWMVNAEWLMSKLCVGLFESFFRHFCIKIFSFLFNFINLFIMKFVKIIMVNIYWHKKFHILICSVFVLYKYPNLYQNNLVSLS